MTDQVAQLVDSSRNFRFLAEPTLVLAGDAAMAESYVDSNPDLAMFLARRFSETLAKILVREHGIDAKKLKSQHERIEALAKAKAIPDRVRQLFDTIRKLGNAAVHEHSSDRQKALSAVEACFELGAWWHHKVTGTVLSHTFDPSAIVETASLREMLKNVEAQLSQLQQVSEAAIRSKSTSPVVLALVGVVVVIVGIAGVVWYTGLDSGGGPTTAGTPSGGLAVHTAVHPVSATKRPLLELQGRVAFVFDREPHALNADVPPSGLDNVGRAIQWAYANGGVDAVKTVLAITVQGRTEEAIVLTDFRVRVIERRNPLPGFLVQVAYGGGPIDARLIKVNLDEPRPRIELWERHEDSTADRGWSFPLKVSSADPEYLYMVVTANTCDCSWVAEIDYVHQGVAATYVVDNGGKPFRTSGDGATKARYSTDDGRRFTWCPASVETWQC